jgi:hypothetical protein
MISISSESCCAAVRGVDGVDLDSPWAGECGPALFGRRCTEVERDGGLVGLLS